MKMKTRLLLKGFLFCLSLSICMAMILTDTAQAWDTPDLCVDLTKEGPATARPGDIISYKFTVENCGSIPLQSGCQVYDPLFGSGPIWSMDVMPGEVMYFYKRYAVTEYDCGEFINNAWAIGGPEDGSAFAEDYASWTVYVDCEPHEQPGTGTPGFWKNHPEAWPVDEITIGCETYSKDDAIAFMDQSVAGDKTITMFKALVAAKLNVLIGNDGSCIADTIASADAWMCTNGPVGSGVGASSYAWASGESLYWTLDAYNNGELCAPARD